MSKYILSALILSLLLVTACTRDICEKSCAGCIELEQPFFISQGCSVYYQISENDHIQIELDNIVDQRHQGILCQSSTGGMATINVNISYNDESFSGKTTTVGCTGTTIPSTECLTLLMTK